ncbi:hypothetical protein AB0D04_37505 [Streptomyces sp. NPDC048483]|uniref:hypothetical protein n=1 Tax=Streptomyces sp. NPDC048483 TaxID=3154927 RepID=UPI00341F8FAB
MPIDVFAALGALVRAEAARNAKKSVPRPVTEPAHDRLDEPAPERPDDSADDRTDTPATTATSPPEARRRPLSRTFRKLTALFR